MAGIGDWGFWILSDFRKFCFVPSYKDNYIYKKRNENSKYLEWKYISQLSNDNRYNFKTKMYL